MIPDQWQIQNFRKGGLSGLVPPEAGARGVWEHAPPPPIFFGYFGCSEVNFGSILAKITWVVEHHPAHRTDSSINIMIDVL